jgi:hypothetical protein
MREGECHARDVMFRHEPTVIKSEYGIIKSTGLLLHMFTQVPIMYRVTGRKAGALEGKGKELRLKMLNECLKMYIIYI